MNGLAVVVDNVSKRFRLFHERNTSLKATLMRGRRSVSDEFWALQDVSFEVAKGSTFGLIGGDIFHGALSLDQMFSARPMLGHGDYRGPLQGLYMCGSGTHPGGGVTGAPGHNAAREIIADFRRGRVKQA